MIGFWMAFLGVIASMGLIWAVWAWLRWLLERWTDDPGLYAALILILLILAAVMAAAITNIGDPR